MRQFFDLLVANIKMTVRNRQSIFWQFVFPILLMSLFGVVFSGGTRDARIAVVNRDGGKMSAAVLTGFKKVKGLEVSTLKFAPAIRRLKAGDTDAVVVIAGGFSKDVAGNLRSLSASPARPEQGASLSSDPSAKGLLSGRPIHAQRQPAKVALYYDPSGTFTSAAARGTVIGVLGGVEKSIAAAPPLIEVREHSVRSSSLRYIDFLVPGIIAMTLMNSAMFGLGGTIVNYRERGILRRLTVTPQPLSIFIAAQITNQLIFSVIRAALLVLVGTALFGAAVLGSYALLGLVIVVGSLCFTTLAFSVASFSRTRETADTLGNIISMPMMFLGGVFFPVDNAPAWIRPLIKVLPLKYLADAMRSIMVKGLGYEAIRTDLLILAVVTAVFFVVSVRFWRWE